jgi:hypothetical protein
MDSVDLRAYDEQAKGEVYVTDLPPSSFCLLETSIAES